MALTREQRDDLAELTTDALRISVDGLEALEEAFAIQASVAVRGERDRPALRDRLSVTSSAESRLLHRTDLKALVADKPPKLQAVMWAIIAYLEGP